MALARRALLLAVVAVCALLLAVGVVAPGEPSSGDPGVVGAVTAATPGATAEARPAPMAGVTKQASPLVLLATSETAAVRRGRRRGRRPAAGPRRRSGPPGARRRLPPDPAVRVDERLARMAMELDVLVGARRY